MRCNDKLESVSDSVWRCFDESQLYRNEIFFAVFPFELIFH